MLHAGLLAPIYEETTKLVNQIVCPSCEITIYDLNNRDGINRARELGVKSLPAIAVNDKLLEYSSELDLSETVLRQSGIG